MYAIYYELKLLDNIKMINTGKKINAYFFNISKYINICRVLKIDIWDLQEKAIIVVFLAIIIYFRILFLE